MGSLGQFARFMGTALEDGWTACAPRTVEHEGKRSVAVERSRPTAISGMESPAEPISRSTHQAARILIPNWRRAAICCSVHNERGVNFSLLEVSETTGLVAAPRRRKGPLPPGAALVARPADAFATC